MSQQAAYLTILAAFGVAAPGAHIAGVVEDPFATGTFDYDANAETDVINLKTPSVWATDPLCANELTTSGSEFDAWIAIEGACVEFLEGEVFDGLDASAIAQVAEGLFLEVEHGGNTRRYRVGMSIAGKLTGQLYTGDPAAAGNGWDWSKRTFPEIVPFAVDLRTIKAAKLVATNAATASVLSQNATVRLHTRGLICANSTASLPGEKGGDQCHANPLQAIATAKGTAKRNAITRQY